MPEPQSRPSAERLARFLGRSDCVFLASPSLALLSVLSAEKTRPSKLLVQDGSPAFVRNIGGLVGALPESTTFDDSEDLRAALRGLGPNAARAWGLATHRADALTPADWFETFEALRVRTVELCLGGLFQLARRGPTAATVTIVSLDDEPAFEGAQLTALLTNDPALAQRVRQLCLGTGARDEAILDAAPRGLAEDEPALLTLFERVIAREEAALAEAKKAGSQRPARGISLSWKRIFHSEAIEETPRAPERPDVLPAPPRGQNPWLARLQATEQEHRGELEQARAALESARLRSVEETQRLQAAADEWKSRFESAVSRVASLSAELAGALAETGRLHAAHEKSLAETREREAVRLAEEEAARRVLLDRVSALESSAAEAAHETSGLAERLKQSHEQYEAAQQEHRGELAQARAALESARLRSVEEAERAQAAADGWKGRFEATEARAASLSEDLAGALAETRRLQAAHEKSAAEAREREAVRLAEGETARRVLLDRVSALELSGAQAASEAKTLAEQLKQSREQYEAAEEEHRSERERERAALESVRLRSVEEAERVQAAADEWKGRFEAAESRSASLSAELAGALAETRRLQAAHEKSLAEASEREAVRLAEGETARRVLLDRVSALELSGAQAAGEAKTLAEQLKQGQEQYEAAEQRHRGELEQAEAALELARLRTIEEARKAHAVADEWKSRLEATEARVASLTEDLGGALAETRRLKADHEKSLAKAKEHEALRLAEGEALRRAHSDRVAALELSAAQAATEAKALAEQLKLSHEQYEASEQERRAEIDRARAALESARLRGVEESHKAQAAADEWKSRLEATESRAASLSAELAGALAETRRLKVDHEKSGAKAKEREALRRAEEETARRVLLDRVSALELSAAQAASEAAALSKEKDGLEEAVRLAGQKHEALAEQLKQSHEQHEAAEQEHRGELERARTALESARLQSVEEAEKAQAVADEWKVRFEATEARAASLSHDLAGALAETRRLKADHEMSVAKAKGREALRRAEEETARRVLLDRVSALELSGAQAASEAAALSKEKDGLEEAVRLAGQKHGALAEQLKQSHEQHEAAEQEHRGELEQARAALESARLQSVEEAQKAQTVADEWKVRFEATEARAASLSEDLAGALAEKRRLKADHEKSLAKAKEREALRLAEGETARRVLLGQVSALEWSVAQAASEAAALSKEKDGLEEAVRLAGQKHEALAEQLKQSHEQHRAAEQEHRGELEQAKAALESVRLSSVEETRKAQAAADEWKGRFQAAESESASLSRDLAAAVADRDVQAKARAAATKDAEKVRAELVSSAQNLKAARAEALGRIEAFEAERADLSARNAATAAERDAEILLRQQAEEVHREALRLAGERADSAERERSSEAARRTAEAADWQARLEAAAEASRQQAEGREAQHSAAVAALQARIVQLQEEAETRETTHLRETAALAEQLHRAEQEKPALLAERDQMLERARRDDEKLRESDEGRRRDQKHFEKEAASWTARLENAASVATKKLQQLETRHAAQIARLEEKASNLRDRSEAATKEAASISRQFAAAERDTAVLLKVRDEIEARWRESEAHRQEALRLADEREAGFKQAALEEAGRTAAALAQWRERFELAEAANAAESRRIEALHAALVARLEDDVQKLWKQGELEAQARQKESAHHQELVRDLQRERAAAVAELQEVQTRSSRLEQEHIEVLRLAEQRLSALEVEKLQEAARLDAALAELQLRFDAASATHATAAQASRLHLDRLEEEKAQALAARSEIEERLSRQLEKETEKARLAVEQYEAVQTEKEEERERLVAAVAAANQQSTVLTERLAVMERERNAALAEYQALESRLGEQAEKLPAALRSAEERASLIRRKAAEETSRLKAQIADGQLRLQAAAKEAANQVLRLEAGHAAAITRIQAEVDRLRKDVRAADEKRQEEAWGFAKRVAVFEKEQAKAFEESGALQRRLRETDAGHRDALRRLEERNAIERREQIEKQAKTAASLAETQRRLEVSTMAATQEAQRLEEERAVEVNLLQAELETIREQAAAAEARHANETARLSEHIAVLERAALSSPPTSDALPEEVEEATAIAEVPEDQPLRGTPPNRSPRLPPESANWEYERILRGGKKKTKMQVLLGEVARRIRGSDAEADG